MTFRAGPLTFAAECGQWPLLDSVEVPQGEELELNKAHLHRLLHTVAAEQLEIEEAKGSPSTASSSALESRP